MHSNNNEEIRRLFLNIHNLPITQIHDLFGQEVCNNIKNQILDYEKDNPVGMESNVKAWSSSYQTHKETDVFSGYLSCISGFSQNIYNNMFSVNQELSLSDFWISHYKRDDFTLKHNHGDSFHGNVISGCYYVHVEEGASPIMFQGEEPIYPKNDTLIIFSSNLYHEVPPTDAERIVMCFNLIQNNIPNHNPDHIKKMENALKNVQTCQ